MTTEKILISQLKNMVETAIRNIYRSNEAKGNIVIDEDIKFEIEEMINHIPLDLKYELRTLLEGRQPVIDVINASSIEEFHYWKKYHTKYEVPVCILEQNDKSGNEKKLCGYILSLIKAEDELMGLFKNRIPSVMFVFRMRSKDIVEVLLVDCPKIGDEDHTHILIYENEFGSFEDEEVLNELKEFLKSELHKLEYFLGSDKSLQEIFIIKDNVEEGGYTNIFEWLRINKMRSLKSYLCRVSDKKEILFKCKNLLVSKTDSIYVNIEKFQHSLNYQNDDLTYIECIPLSEIHIIREKC